MRYAVGLDIGIASVGYSILELDSDDKPCRIVKLGSRVFEKAEVPKTGDPLAAERREYRCARRTLRRRKHRKERIRKLICSAGLLSPERLERLYEGKALSDVYELRVKALDKIRERISSFVEVNDGTGIAANGDMIRIDVFYVENDGYYFVPIYVSDTVKAELPNMAPTARKDANGRKIWEKMEESDFQFSLYPNDLIKIYSRKDIQLSLDEKLEKSGSTLPKTKSFNGRDGVYLYNKGMDISVAVIKGVTHDGTYLIRSIGKTIDKIEKYEVDAIGNVKPAGKECRQKFIQKRS